MRIHKHMVGMLTAMTIAVCICVVSYKHLRSAKGDIKMSQGDSEGIAVKQSHQPLVSTKAASPMGGDVHNDSSSGIEVPVSGSLEENLSVYKEALIDYREKFRKNEIGWQEWEALAPLDDTVKALVRTAYEKHRSVEKMVEALKPYVVWNEVSSVECVSPDELKQYNALREQSSMLLSEAAVNEPPVVSYVVVKKERGELVLVMLNSYITRAFGAIENTSSYLYGIVDDGDSVKFFRDIEGWATRGVEPSADTRRFLIGTIEISSRLPSAILITRARVVGTGGFAFSLFAFDSVKNEWLWFGEEPWAEVSFWRYDPQSSNLQFSRYEDASQTYVDESVNLREWGRVQVHQD